MKKEGIKKGVYILPNLLTTANMFCGFYAIFLAINKDYVTAAWTIMSAGIFDFLDGRVARMTNTQSKFGLEYDSLSDLTSFGMAPAILMFTWTLHQYGRIGWLLTFVYFACCALRLARFNVQVADVEKKNFQGLPSPAAAGCITSFVVFHHYLFGPGEASTIVPLIMTGSLGVLMVSNVSYRSFKVLDQQRTHFFFLVAVVGVLFIIAVAPQVMLFVFAIIYISAGIIEAIIQSPKQIAGLVENINSNIKAKKSGKKDASLNASDELEPALRVVGLKGRPDHQLKSKTDLGGEDENN